MSSLNDFVQGNQNPAANINMRVGVQSNPDQAASDLALARRFNLPADAVAQDRELFSSRASAADAQQVLLDRPKTAAWVAANPNNAKVAHDDVGMLGAIEGKLNDVGIWARNTAYSFAGGIDNFIMDDTPARLSVPAIVKQVPAALGSGTVSALSGLAGVAEAGSEAADNYGPTAFVERRLFGGTLESKFANVFRNVRLRAQDVAAANAPDTQAVPGFAGQSILGGIASVPSTAAALGITLATASPLAGASFGGAVQGGQSYGAARDQGVGVGKSLLYGLADFASETGTEFLPEAKFLEETKAGSSVLHRFLATQLQEQMGEQAATALQDLTAWAVLPSNADKTFGDYLADRPKAALATAIQTLVVGAATNAGVSVLEKAANLPAAQARRERVEQAAAAQHADQLKEILQMAGESKLRERDPVSFHNFLEQQTEDGPLEHVYVDGRQLNQTLTEAGPEGAALAQSIPAIGEQLQQAIETGGDVRIPVAQLTTVLPGSTLEQSLVDHLRTDPLAQSAAEAKEESKTTMDRLQQGFEAQLGEQQGNDAFTASRDNVVQHFTDQLNTANRFTTDVNQRYATLLGSFYAVQAAKLGITPEDMLKRYPLQVRSSAGGYSDEEGRMGQDVEASIFTPSNLTAEETKTRNDWRTIASDLQDGDVFEEPATGERLTVKRSEAGIDKRGKARGLTITLTDSEGQPVHSLVSNGGDGKDLGFLAGMAGENPIILSKTAQPKALVGLPMNAVGPTPRAQDAAHDYMSKLGLVYDPPRTYQKVDKARAKRIADAFDKMQHNPSDPLTQTAYHAMIGETLAQWQTIKATGLKVEFIKGDDPYGNPRNAILDVRDNNHLWVFPTDAGFGSSDLDVSDNPLLAIVPGETISGQSVRANDIFRIVHDYFGHIKEGVGFRADGEENAWRSHSAMYTPLARRAMTTETRGQNSWVNFGQHGEANRTASPADTVYAPQKIGLLPEWVSEEGAHDPAPDRLNQGPSPLDSPPVDADGNVTLQHFSGATSLTRTDPAQWGSDGGKRLAREERAKVGQWLGRTYFGIATGETGGYKNEFGPNMHAYTATVPADKLYDIMGDPDGFKAKGAEIAAAKGWSRFGVDPLERMIHDEGYTGYWVKNGELGLVATVFDPLDVQPAEANAPAYAQTTRGYITFGRDITAQPSTISLLNASDLSTFLHESGHFFLEVMSHMASQPNAPAQVVADMATSLKWMGVEGGQAQWNSMTLEQKREFHEKFARGFETYLFEGKTPNAELRGVFQRFRAWLVSVYNNKITNLRAKLNDEIRGVFDRMIASTESIREAEAQAQLGPIFDAKPDTMTDTAWEEYQALGISATAEAIDELQTKSLRDMRFAKRVHSRELKRLKAEIAGQRELVEEEVRNEISSQPVYRATDFMRKGLLDGEPVDGPHKLSIDEVKAEFQLADESFFKKLGYGKYGMLSRENGVNPNQIAEMFGFSSGDELIKSVVAAPDMQEEIDAATELRMLERYGDINSPAALDAAASAAIHNEVRARFVATELGALEKGVGKSRLLAKAAKQYAEDMIRRVKVRNVRPTQYEAAERRAAVAALKAVKANDIALATTEKRNQLLNLYATKAARNAQDDIRKTIDYFRKFARTGTRQNIDPAYLDQIDAMLDRFDFRTGVTETALAKRKSLAEWIDAQRAQGFEPAIDPDLENEARRQSYRDLTVDEMAGLRDAIRNIEHLGRLKKQLLRNKDQRDLAAAVESGAAAIVENAYKTVKQNVGAKTWLENAKSGVNDFLAMHRKFSSVIREMDGSRDNGVLWGLFARPMNDAGNNEAVMTASATAKLSDIFDALVGEDLRTRRHEPAINASISLETRLMVALNWGNETNRSRIRDGDNWTDEQVAAILAPLTAKHWDFVKNVWSHINSYWPEIAAKEKRVTGVEPEKVTADAFTIKTSDGETLAIPGGYFPIKYDPDKSTKAEADTANEVQQQLQKGLYTRATTRRGHTKARVDTVERAVRKDFGVVFQHNAEVIHDLSWHETLIDLNRLLRAGQIDEAIRTHYGPQTLTWMRKAMEDIAIGGLPAANALERSVNYLRTGATVAGLGWNLMTSLFQPLGLTNSMARIGPKYVGRGIGKVFSDAASMNNTVTWVREQSDFMRLRGQTQMREIAEIRQNFVAKGPIRTTIDRVPGASKTLDVVNASMFLMIEKAQVIADIPTWAGAYEKAVDEGNDHERSVALADQAVIDSQGGGQIKDLAGIQRGGPFQKLWTNFYSWFNVAYNQLAESVNDTRRVGPSRLPLLAADFALIAFLPAFLTSLLRGGVGGDDWDKLGKRIINDQLGTYLGFWFGARELGAMFGVGSSYSGPAGARAIDATVKLGKQAQQGEADAAFWKAANNAAGVLFHYPAGQVQRTVLGVEALADGKTKNPLVVMTGPPPKR